MNFDQLLYWYLTRDSLVKLAILAVIGTIVVTFFLLFAALLVSIVDAIALASAGTLALGLSF